MANRLAHETSPYLRRHADDLVDWHPWGAEALALAKRLDRPILLSIGYPACHWCHVMAHESFGDADIAALAARYFVAIKVDREERPDLDQVYQAAHQAITQRGGGWPLTVFLTPEGRPFHAGTYYPRTARHGLPGFDALLARIGQLWDERRDELVAHGDEVVRFLQTLPDGAQARGVDARAVEEGHLLDDFAPKAARAFRDALMPEYDRACGGFGGAPKFPQPAPLAALLHASEAGDDREARDAVATTLSRMAEGGLHDQLGGGFCRYCVDAHWRIPHFEKMLCDNGALLRLYAQAWRFDRSPLFRRVCADTAQWAIREMQSPGGGYYGSRDADSEGEEGRFYLWDRDEVARELGNGFAPFAARYGLDAPPNFEGRAWHLHVAQPVEAIAARFGVADAQAAAQIDRAREQLYALRETRAHPGLDEKVLTGWNALMIEGMSFAARVFDEPRWRASARDALDFVRDVAWRDGRLLAAYEDGHARLDAWLDDHAFLLGALLEAMQDGVLRVDDLRFACALADALLDRFEDPDAGGFFFTGRDHEKLVLRPKSAVDAATMSGNGAAALYLQRLGHLVGDARYLDAARRVMACFAASVRDMPHAFATLVTAMSEYARPPALVLLAGPGDECARWSRALARDALPAALVFTLPASAEGLPAALARPAARHAQAWVCRGTQCLPVIESLDDLREGLAGR